MVSLNFVVIHIFQYTDKPYQRNMKNAQIRNRTCWLKLLNGICASFSRKTSLINHKIIGFKTLSNVQMHFATLKNILAKGETDNYEQFPLLPQSLHSIK